MIDTVFSYVLENQMIEKGDYVVAGVSGGADSVCLLLVLQELRKRIPFTLKVVHIEHGIRGKESQMDADFVEKLCREQQVACRIFHRDIPADARACGRSVEETARMYRYEIFAEEAGRHKQGKIAIAHNQNDNAETMLHNLVRGSAVKGLAGIAPVRDNVIRPLLCLTRGEIEEYLHKRGVTYCTDSTNLDVMYTRNKIRHEILPGLCEINPQAVAHMAQSARTLRETYEYMRGQAAQAAKTCVICHADGSADIRVDVYRSYPTVIRQELLHTLITKLAGCSRDVSGIHLELVDGLIEKQTGREIELPYGITAVRSYETIHLARRPQCEDETEQADEIRQEIVADHHPDFSMRVLETPVDSEEIPKKKYTKWFDYDKIGNILCVRTRKTGDFLTLDDETGSTQKLKKYFVNEKIPQNMRDQILLLADGQQIVWIVGYRISAYYKVTGNTRRILEVQYHGGKEENE